ncbi:MAG: hypothetical protein HZA91_04310 [Verrucomicrobia bacterium]|nr:hypothetical protein [Verrucomicrobiota bacterium]
MGREAALADKSRVRYMLDVTWRSQWLVSATGLLFVAALLTAAAEEPPPLRLAQTIALPHVEGRIDHLAVDVARQRLFVAALGNNTVEVVDLASGAVAKSVGGFREPQGIACAPELDKLFVASGGDGLCKILDSQSLQVIKTIQLGDDADNVRYDDKARRVYVGDTGLAILDAASDKHVADIKLAAHPESFQLERNGPRIFVNVPKAGCVAVVDREKRAVVATWPLRDAAANFPMALDEANHRLFIGCRKPPKLLVLDAESGKSVAALPIDGDTDDLFCDAARRRLYVICGAGFIDVFQQTDADHYTLAEKIPTATGARTGLFVPALNRLYVAVPHRGERQAAILVYEVPPGPASR